MSSWRECKLGEIAEVNPTESLKKGTVAKKIPMDVLQPFTKKIPKFDIEPYNGGVKFRNGDTLVARITPSLENGKTSFVDILDEDEVGFGSTEFIVLREKENQSDKHFLYYLAISPEFREIAIKSMTGSSGRQRVQNEVVFKYEFLIPPLEEQKAIAEVLSSLDDKIDLLHRQNRTLEELAQTLFRQWFIEEAKEEWEKKPLKDICTIINGFAFKSGDYRESGRAIIRTMNFKQGFIDTSNVVYIDLAEEIKYSKQQLQRNDFLLVMVGASLGNFSIVTSDVLPALQNQNMWNFRSLGNISQHYLNFALRQIIENNIGSASGSAREFFQKGQFYEFLITVPSKEIVQRFHDSVENFFLKIENNRMQIQTLEKLRDTLLPKLLSGEVRVEI